MPAGSKVDAAEKGLEASARKKGLAGKKADAYIYGTLNRMGFMRGNKTTAAGKKKARTVMGGDE